MISRDVVVLEKNVYMGGLTCHAAFHLHISDYYPYCGYFYHYASGHWKPEPDWCKRSIARCFANRYASKLIILLILIVVVTLCNKSRKTRCCWCCKMLTQYGQRVSNINGLNINSLKLTTHGQTADVIKHRL